MIFDFDRLIWLIPFAFYVFDNIKLVAADDIIVTESYTGGFSFVLTAVPFSLAGRIVVFLNAIMPHGFSFRFKWLMPESKNWEVLDERDSIDEWVRSLREMRVVGIAAALNLFLLGPVLTELSGFVTAAMTVVAEHLVLLLFVAFKLRERQEHLKLSNRQIGSMIFEFVACPGYLANICKRLSLVRQIAPVDGCLFFALCGRREQLSDLRDALRLRLQDLTAMAADSAELDRIEAYRARLGV